MKRSQPRHSLTLPILLLTLLSMPVMAGAQDVTKSAEPEKAAVTPPAEDTPAAETAMTPPEPVAPTEPTPGTTPPSEAERLPNAPADACQGGYIVDDGKADKGYSFVSSAKWGMYVQKVESEKFPSRHLQNVCVCWFQKPGGGDADFEVLFFTAEGERPAMEPYAKVKATAKALGQGKLDAKWHTVDVAGVSIPEGVSYIGVRWRPKKEPRLFVCSDHSSETPRQVGFFGEDRSKGWVNLETTSDPIFIPHRALLLRTVSHPQGWQPPPQAAPAASATPIVEPKAPALEPEAEPSVEPDAP